MHIHQLFQLLPMDHGWERYMREYSSKLYGRTEGPDFISKFRRRAVYPDDLLYSFRGHTHLRYYNHYVR